MMRNVVRDAADEHLFEPAQSTASHDDQVGGMLLCVANDRVVRVSAHLNVGAVDSHRFCQGAYIVLHRPEYPFRVEVGAIGADHRLFRLERADLFRKQDRGDIGTYVQYGQRGGERSGHLHGDSRGFARAL